MQNLTNETAQEASRPRFFVYVIESPSAPDLYHGRSEGALLAQAAALDRMPSITRTAVNYEAFVAALRIGLAEVMKTYPDHLPILHISAHGAQEGLQLSDGSLIPWSTLRDLLIPVNKSLRGFLLLCMSVCKGYSACQMAMRLDADEHPYWTLIANTGNPTWSDTAIAYAALYHLISKGRPYSEAIHAMRAASGDQGWVLETAELAKRAFSDYIATLNLSQARQSLEAAIDSPDVPEGSKIIEAAG